MTMFKNIYLLVVLFLTILSDSFGNTDSLLNAYQNAKNPKINADLLNELADFYMNRNLDSALLYCDKALEILQNSNYQTGEFKTLTYLNQIFLATGKPDSATSCLDRMKMLSEQLSDKKMEAKYHLLLGCYHLYLNEYNLAMEDCVKSYKLFLETGDIIGTGDAQARIGQILLAMNRNDEMYEYFQKALANYTQVNYRRGIISMMNNFGMYFFIKEDYEKAEKYYHQAIALNKQARNNYGLSINYLNLSEVKQEMGQIDSVFYYSNEALKLAQNVGNPYWEAITLLHVGEINEFFSNENSIALAYYTDALNLAVKVNSFESISNITNRINEFYYKAGNIDSAYIYLQQHYKYADSLSQLNNASRFEELKYKLEAELQLERIAAQNQKRVYIFVLIFSFLTMMIIILVMYSNKQKIKIRNTLLAKENLSNRIELKNKELASNILAGQKKNEIIRDVVKNIKESRSIKYNNSDDILDHVIGNLNNLLDEKGWDEFEIIFQQVHESFFKNLGNEFPELSAKEKRLCSLLRLNMTSKEIASVTRMTPASVDTARCRLRKKLGLDASNEDLSIFLGTF